MLEILTPEVKEKALKRMEVKEIQAIVKNHVSPTPNPNADEDPRWTPFYHWLISRVPRQKEAPSHGCSLDIVVEAKQRYRSMHGTELQMQTQAGRLRFY